MGSYQIWKWFAIILCEFACEYLNCEQGPNERTTEGATGRLTVGFYHKEQPKAIISFPLKNNNNNNTDYSVFRHVVVVVDRGRLKYYGYKKGNSRQLHVVGYAERKNEK